MYDWLMGVEYDVYHNTVYFLLYLNMCDCMICWVEIMLMWMNLYIYVCVCVCVWMSIIVMITLWCWIIVMLLIIMMIVVELLRRWCWWIIYVYVHICCWWFFFMCYWCWLNDGSMYWNMLVLIVEVVWIYALLLLLSHKFTHTVDVGFYIHVVDEYFLFNYSGWNMMCMLHHGVTTSELTWYLTCLKSV